MEIFDYPEGRLLRSLRFSDLAAPGTHPEFARVVMESLRRRYPAPDKPHPVPFRPDMHGFRAAVETALGATVRSRARNTAQISTRAGDRISSFMHARQEAASVSVPFIDTMPFAYRSARRRRTAGAPTQPSPAELRYRAVSRNLETAAAAGAPFSSRQTRPPQRAPYTTTPLRAGAAAAVRGDAFQPLAPPVKISFADRPRRKCRCAGGSRWPTNR